MRGREIFGDGIQCKYYESLKHNWIGLKAISESKNLIRSNELR